MPGAEWPTEVIRAYQQAAMAAEYAEHERQRPFYLLRPDLTCMECQGQAVWSATYGACVGRGNTPAEAAKSFDVVWRVGRLASKSS